MSSKISKLEISIKDSSHQSVESPEISKKDKIKEVFNDNELNNLIFERTIEENSEIKNLQKIYYEKLKEIEKLSNEIKIKDEEISLMNNSKNKFPSLSQENRKEQESEKTNLSEEDLKSELLKLDQEYNEEVQRCTNQHEEKINNMKEEINQLKNKINFHYNKNEYISKEEYDKVLNDLSKKHEEELEPYKKELNDLKKFLADNFPNIKYTSKE